jgi:pilus assembly protein CpaB
MRRTLGILAGLLAAVIGTLVLMSVVENSADDAATEAPQLGSVLVVKTVIPRQTGVDLIAPNVEITQIPVDLIAPGAVSSLDAIPMGLVTSTELLPGEQLLLTRFVDPRLQSRLVVPEGLQEITISLPAPRILGGNVVAGDTVGVVASFVVKTEDSKELPSTTFILHKVLVTSIQFSNADATAIEQSLGTLQSSVNRYPAESVLVTLAVSAVDAARIVYTAEFGTMWLTLEGQNAAVGDEGVFDITDFVTVAAP